MKLTILNVAYPFAPIGRDAVGGAEQVLTALDHALVDAGHRSIVVACEKSQARGELVSSACHETLSAELCGSARREHRLKITEALARWPIEIIHMHGVDFYEYLPDTSLPVLVTLHLPLAFYPERVLRDLPANVHLLCVSRSQVRDWLTCGLGQTRSRNPLSHRRQHVVPAPGSELLPVIENGVDVKKLSTRHAKRNFAVALGRICPEKGFHHAVQAARRANIPLFVGGEVFGYEAHQRYFVDHFLPQLDRQRRWLGPVHFTRKRRLLSAARCLLVPSLVAETSSLVAMEALACGTPVIAFPNGALREIVEDGRTGFLVANEVEMAAAIGKAHLIDPERCRAAARERFCLERTCATYLEVYARLAAESGRGRKFAEAPCVV